MAAESTTAQIQELRSAGDKHTDSTEGPDGELPASLSRLQQLLQEAQAALAAVQARHADFEARLTYQTQRPAAVSERLELAAEEREATAARLQSPDAEMVSTALSQAKRWELETRHVVLSSEIKRLGQELLSRPLRMDLLEAKRDRTTAQTVHITAVVASTNNVAEHFFGADKQKLHRRLGRANLGRDLEDQPAQAALAANLRHSDYVRVLCGSLEHLPAAFAEFNQKNYQRVRHCSAATEILGC